MSKMIQLRNVSDDLHRKLKARAAQEGMSLSDYLLNEIQKTAERPTLSELRMCLDAQAISSGRLNEIPQGTHPTE